MRFFYITIIFSLFPFLVFCQFGPENIIVTYDTGSDIIPRRYLSTGDLNGDNVLDLVMSTQELGLIWYDHFDNPSNSSVEVVISNELGQPHAIGDIDGDGDLDILASGNNSVVWYENDGLGNFETSITISDVNYFSYDIDLLDIDHDGDLDAVYPGNEQVVYNLNLDGLGNFGPQIIAASLDYFITKIEPKDMDADGDTDLLITEKPNNYNERISWFENTDGNGNFSLRKHLFYYNSDFSLPYEIADIDGNQQLDFIAGYDFDDLLFWRPTSISTPNSYHNFLFNGIRDMAIGDMDNDGDLDLATIFSTDFGRLSWFENDGIGNFQNENDAPFMIHPKSLLVVDMDDDNDLDIIVSANNTFNSIDRSKISWRVNDGFGNFSEEIIIADYEFSDANFEVKDMDGDNDLDLYVVSDHSRKVAWFENLGSEIVSNAPEVSPITFKVLPNPTSEAVTIISNKSVPTSLEIINMNGVSIHKQQVNSGDQVELNLYPAGVYFFKMITERKIIWQKIVKN